MKKVILTVVIVLAVVLVVSGIFLYLNKDQLVSQIMQKSLHSLQVTVIGSLKTEEQKEEVKAVFDRLNDKIRTGAIDKEGLQDLGYTLQKSFEDKKLDDKETEIIVEKLKALAGPEKENPR